MRRFVSLVAMATVLGLGATSASNAAPVPGFEPLYDSVVASCTVPAGTVLLCEAAINAYSQALVAGVEQAKANASFTGLRSDVFTDNAGTGVFQKNIDDLFERLLPDSGAIGGLPGAPAAGGAPRGPSGDFGSTGGGPIVSASPS